MIDFTAVDGIVEKLNRADQYIKNLDREINAFLDKAPDREIVNYDSEAEKAFRSFHENARVPIPVSIITGEILYHLRSSLDHLLCALVVRDGGTPGDATQFPICYSRPDPAKKKEFRRYQRQIEGIKRPEVLARIDGFQPHTRGNDAGRHWLYTLKGLSNGDKHRALILHVALVHPRIQVKTVMENGFRGTYDGPDDGAEIPADYIDPSGKFVQIVDVQRRLTALVAFRKFGNVNRTIEVVDGLRAFWRGTHEIVSALALFLTA